MHVRGDRHQLLPLFARSCPLSEGFATGLRPPIVKDWLPVFAGDPQRWFGLTAHFARGECGGAREGESGAKFLSRPCWQYAGCDWLLRWLWAGGRPIHPGREVASTCASRVRSCTPVVCARARSFQKCSTGDGAEKHPGPDDLSHHPSTPTTYPIGDGASSQILYIKVIGAATRFWRFRFDFCDHSPSR